MQASAVRRGLLSVLDLIFPPQCVLCGAESEVEAGKPHFCGACDVAVSPACETRCPLCAQRCSTADIPLGNCGDCRGHKMLFSASRTLGAHEGRLREAVLKAKHAFHEPLAFALGQQLALSIAQCPFTSAPDLIVPVPMHWLRRLSRRTHPAGTLARAAAEVLHLPLSDHAFIGSRAIRHQSSLSGAERRKNVRGAFSVRWPKRLRGKRILLVDDVMTTGETARECARVLLQSGAATVYVATVSRNAPGNY